MRVLCRKVGRISRKGAEAQRKQRSKEFHHQGTKHTNKTIQFQSFYLFYALRVFVVKYLLCDSAPLREKKSTGLHHLGSLHVELDY
jgi:hypothetical protein